MTTIQNHWTDKIEVIIITFEGSQWRKIYSFILSFILTFHRQCVLVVVGCFANRLSIITTITFKSPNIKLNGLQLWQIWIINPLIQSLSNTTEWTYSNADLPRLTDWSWGRSVNSNQSISQTRQWEGWSIIETKITNINGLKRRKIAQLKTGYCPEYAVTNHQWL